MRVALVATGGFDRSGRERIIPAMVALVGRLARAHDVFVYVLRYHDAPCSYPLAGATIRDLGSPRGMARQCSALLRALRADRPFDVLHAYWGVPAGLVAAAAGRLLGVPAVVTCDSGEFVALPDIGYGQQLRLRHRVAITAATRLAARVTVCTEYQARLARQHGLSPEVIPLGVDLDTFGRRSEPPEGPPWRLLHVASINPVKDHETLLRAFSRLAARGIDARLDIVGVDTLQGGTRALASSLGVADRVTFHGFLPTDALVPLYHAAHLSVLTSRHEAAGVVLLESAACGVPVIGSRVGYIADWAPDAATAVPPHDPDTLAETIERLLGDPARRGSTADAAHRWARSHDADGTARQFAALYVRLATGHAVGRKATA